MASKHTPSDKDNNINFSEIRVNMLDEKDPRMATDNTNKSFDSENKKTPGHDDENRARVTPSPNQVDAAAAPDNSPDLLDAVGKSSVFSPEAKSKSSDSDDDDSIMAMEPAFDTKPPAKPVAKAAPKKDNLDGSDDDDDSSIDSILAMPATFVSSSKPPPVAALPSSVTTAAAVPSSATAATAAATGTAIAMAAVAASLPAGPFNAAQNLLLAALANTMGNPEEEEEEYTYTPPAAAARPESVSSRGVAEKLSTLAEERELLIAEEKNVDWKNTQRELDKMFDEVSANKFQGIAPYQHPREFKASLNLYDYQKDGIRWLLHQEVTGCIGPFWKQRVYGRTPETQTTWWSCTLTNQRQRTKPEPCHGSILADEMGLGKSIQTLGLMLSNASYSRIKKCTLIVCPVSVIANWKIQIKQFIKPGVWNVAVFHGPKRHKLLSRVKLGDVDVLLTSYGTLHSEYKQYEEMLKAQEEEEEDETKQPKKKLKMEPTIFDLQFRRIVLDEAHIIRNSKTGFFKSVMAVQAEYKLCLTGTPFVNRPTDIHSLLAFLGAEPLSRRAVFNACVVKPISETKEIGLARIRTVMSHLALRRTKAAVDNVIELPPKQVILKSIEFPEGYNKSVHDALYETARAAFIGLLRADLRTLNKNFWYLVQLVLRVRQSCCDANLVPEDCREIAEAIHREGIDLDAVEGADLLMQLMNVINGDNDNETDQDVDKECAVCLEELIEQNSVVLRTCKHVLCEACLNKIANQLCPYCRTEYTERDMIKKNVAEQAVKSGGRAQKNHDGEIAPKVRALLEEIGKMAKDEKAVIFSQWTSYLNVIQTELGRNGHSFTRIDGTMSAADRLFAMEEFSSDLSTSPRFILCSINACGTGINLTRGNVVFMMDFWWNYSVESQAMDRVHRIGQTRDVRVVRFAMKDSLEFRMVNLQDAKSALGKGSLQKLTREERRKARITAMRDLFEVEEALVQNWQGYYEEDERDPTLNGFIVPDGHVE